jgi:hypothetical protein
MIEHCYRVLSGGKTKPQATIDWAFWNIHEYIVLPVDTATEKRTDILVDTGGKVYAYTVIPLTQAEIEANTEAKLNSDLQQAMISSALLMTEVFTVLNTQGVVSASRVIDASLLSDEAKASFVVLSTLASQKAP